MEALKIRIQCKHKGKTGSFLSDINGNVVSPVLDSFGEVMDWVRERYTFSFGKGLSINVEPIKQNKKVVSFMDIEQIADFLQSVNCKDINPYIQSIADKGTCIYEDYLIFHDEYAWT